MLFEKIKVWYNGEQKVRENDPDSPIVRIGTYTQRHWTANSVRAFVNFYLNHWKWLWSTIIAILGLIFAYLKLAH